MHTHHTWFVANDSQLDHLFPGWLPTIPKEPSGPSGPRWAADGTPAEPYGLNIHHSPDTRQVAPVLSPTDDHEQMLEEQTPAGLRALPHFSCENPTFDFIEELSAHLCEEVRILPVRVGPENSCAEIYAVEGLPVPVAAALASYTDAQLEELTEEMEGETSAEDLVRLLDGLRLLAKTANLVLATLLVHWVVRPIGIHDEGPQESEWR